MNWVLISGEFKANGDEQILTIGNFRNDSNTSVSQVQSFGFSPAYYYIDDISVTLCDTVGVKELGAGSSEFGDLKIYPNPFSETTTISFFIPEKNYGTVSIYNLLGEKIKEVKSDKIGNNQMQISAVEIGKGIYFCQLETEGKGIATKKMVIVR